MAALFVGLLFIYLQYRAESVRRIETLASMVLRQAHEDIQAGHPNEAAARLAEAVRLHPKDWQHLPDCKPYYVRHPIWNGCQANLIGSRRDNSWMQYISLSARKPLLVIRDEKGLAIYDGSSGTALAVTTVPVTDEQVRVRLSPHTDRIAIWRTRTDGQGIEAATYQFGNNNDLNLEARLPSGLGDVCFLKDGTLSGAG